MISNEDALAQVGYLDIERAAAESRVDGMKLTTDSCCVCQSQLTKGQGSWLCFPCRWVLTVVLSSLRIQAIAAMPRQADQSWPDCTSEELAILQRADCEGW
jgi:hypothetical protein